MEGGQGLHVNNVPNLPVEPVSPKDSKIEFKLEGKIGIRLLKVWIIW